MQEDRFKRFMNSVETVVDEKQTSTEASVLDPEVEEKNEEPYQTEFHNGQIEIIKMTLYKNKYRNESGRDQWWD